MWATLPTAGTFEVTPAGVYPAICYRFIDKGTQRVTYGGDAKDVHQVMVSWELPTELMEDGRPFSMHKTYTWSWHEKATLRKDLEAWRGRKFTDTDLDHGFNTRSLLGVPCLLQVMHVEKAERTFANVGSLSPLVKGMEAPRPVNPQIYLSLTRDGWDAKTFEGLSDGLKQTIMKSPEYKEMFDPPFPGDRIIGSLD